MNSIGPKSFWACVELGSHHEILTLRLPKTTSWISRTLTTQLGEKVCLRSCVLGNDTRFFCLRLGDFKGVSSSKVLQMTDVKEDVFDCFCAHRPTTMVQVSTKMNFHISEIWASSNSTNLCPEHGVHLSTADPLTEAYLCHNS